jgi:hypothetical protein
MGSSQTQLAFHSILCLAWHFYFENNLNQKTPNAISLMNLLPPEKLSSFISGLFFLPFSLLP